MQPLRIAVSGSVDHGKSTLIGRLLSDTDQIKEDRKSKVKAICESTGKKFEYAFLLDALDEEQQQGITIDITEVQWTFKDKAYTIIDTPGHREFLKNMVGGASQADAAILVIDALEGLKTQFHRQVSVVAVLGISEIIVVINKMDLVKWSEDVFKERSAQVKELFARVGLKSPVIVPIAAWTGDNLLEASKNMPWYDGSTLGDAISALQKAESKNNQPLRFPIQDTYKFSGKFSDDRIYVGRIESGQLSVGDRIQFLPSGGQSRITSIQSPSQGLTDKAQAGEAVGITLEDPLFLERGELGHHFSCEPRVSKQLTADIFWLAKEPLINGQSLDLRLHTGSARALVEDIESVLDSDTLESVSAEKVESGGFARIALTLDKAIAYDFFQSLEGTGRIVLTREGRVVGGGRILARESQNTFRSSSLVSRHQRVKRNGHKAFVVWCTGLSGSGKSTLMRELEKRLFDQGLNVFTLDGDNVRSGVSKDLGFSDQDRSENIRRVAEIAKLFTQAGVITLTAFISPFARDREIARQIIGEEHFIEVFIDCPLEVCRTRDPKQLYLSAEKGQIAQFTGVSSPYEPPKTPDIVIKTHEHSIDQCVNDLLQILSASKLQFGASIE